MKNFTKITSLILALLMLTLCFASCGGDDGKDPVATTTSGESGAVTTDPSQKSIEVKDWGGEMWQVLGRDSNQMSNYEIDSDALNGEVVNDAVYARNEALKTKYNFEVVGTLVSNPASIAQNLYLANEDVYDAVFCKPVDLVKHAQKGYFLDLSTLNYINLEHSSWDQQANAELTINGKIFFANSDFCIQAKARTYFMMYNRELLHTHDAYADFYVEDLVESGEWTIAKYYEIAKDYSEDLDGGGAGGKMDQWALCADGKGVTRNFAFGGGYRVCNNNDGVVALAPVDDKVLDIIDQCLKATCDATMTLHPQMFQPLDYALGIDTFADGRSLFLSDLPSSFDLSLGSGIDFEYGILPYPKYDTQQENYYTQFNYENASCVAVPYTVGDPDFAGYCLEATTEESTETSLAAYIETKCKLHNSYDQRCSDMLDILYANVVYDMGAILNVGGAYGVLYDAVNYYPMNAYQRLYNKVAEAAGAEVEELMTSGVYAAE